MFKNLNILFVMIFVLALGSISFFNYIVDPYNIIIDRPSELQLYNYPKDIFSSVLKLSTKSNYNTLAFGGSTTDAFLNYNLFPKNHAMLTSGYITSDTLKDYIKFFIKNHPELKTVVFNVEYASYYFEKEDKFPEIKNKNLTIKELARLFLSVDSTIESIKKFKKNPKKILDKNRFQHRNIKENIEPNFKAENLFDNTPIINKKDTLDIKYEIFIKRNDNHHIKGLKKNINEYFDDYIEFFDENNVNVIYVFPAYHAMLQSKLYKEFDYSDVEKIKRHIVNKTNKRILDFAYINKYTTEDLEQTYLYADLIHPYSYKYNFFYCVLNNLKEHKNKDVYVELTKENIDKVLSEQRKRLENYVSKNNDKINEFLSYEVDNFYIEKNSKDAPNCTNY